MPADVPAPTMPAEWEAHERTWMAFPPPNATFGDEGSDTLLAARRTWATVARVIARHEPVTLLAGNGQVEIARTMLGDEAGRIDIVEVAIDDAWLRDSGPSFVRTDKGELAAVNWIFNGWGGQDWAAWGRDAQVATSVARLAGVPVLDSKLTNEGGGFHVDGEGTVLLTETVQRDPGRNPGWTRADVEAELHAHLGTSTAIWLPRGLTRDYDRFGTRGHVDIVACFVRPGVVAVHSQRDRAHPDFEVSAEAVELLSTTTDARDRRLSVIEVPAPAVLEVDGGPADYSYINHLVANGAVIVGTFDDPHDAQSLQVLSDAYPGRTIEAVDARGIFANGGGVHCITQQQPA
jgi:agmatine deiminase